VPDGVSEFWIYLVYGKFYLKVDIQRFGPGKPTSLLAPKTSKLMSRKPAQFLILHALFCTDFFLGGGGGWLTKRKFVLSEIPVF
jgi:hypothetical protein